MLKYWRRHWWVRWSGIPLLVIFLGCCVIGDPAALLIIIGYILFMGWAFVGLSALVSPRTDADKLREAQEKIARVREKRPWLYHERIEQHYHQERDR